MKLWAWYRARRGWLKILIALVGIPSAILLAYVGGRSLQYIGAEKDAGRYVPEKANVVFRAREFRAHADRITDTLAWRVLYRKILRDPSLRRELNDLLKGGGLPTLDDLEDGRQVYARRREDALDLVGGDALVSMEVAESWERAGLCAAVRLPWKYYLAAPFARFVLPSEDGALRVKRGKESFFLAFEGRLALVSNRKELLDQALRRRGPGDGGARPLEGRLTFGASAALAQVRKALKDSGAFSYVRWDTVRAVSLTGDLRDSNLLLDAAFEGGEAVVPLPPPVRERGWAPETSSGILVHNSSVRDLFAGIREAIGTPGPRDVGLQNALQGLEQLDQAGFSSEFLPRLESGMTVVLGLEEENGLMYPTVAVIIPSKNPKAAADAMTGIIRKIGGRMAENPDFMVSQPVENTVMYGWTWPGSIKKWGNFFQPRYAALEDAFVFGNNGKFVQSVIRASVQGGGFETAPGIRKFRTRLRETGFAEQPPLAGGYLFPPLVRESLECLVQEMAKQQVYGALEKAGPQYRAEVTRELQQQLGRAPTTEEVNEAYRAGEKRKIEETEETLRDNVRLLDSVKWVAWEAASAPRGIAFRLALEFK